MLRSCLALAAALVLAGAASAQTRLSIGSFNVESDLDTEAARVAEDMARIPMLHVWALQEVTDQAELDSYIAALSEATGYTYAGQLGTTGGGFSDHLAIVYIQDAFSNVSFDELEEVGGARFPLAMRGTTWTGEEIVFVNNHFDRRDERMRETQARSLRDWIQDHEGDAIVLMGTFNFDYDFQGSRRGGNRAFVQFSRGGHASWPEPMCIANGTCPATGSACNPQYDTMTDFIFLAGRAFDWRAVTDMAFLDEDYCRNDPRGHSDHRPLLGQILLP